MVSLLPEPAPAMTAIGASGAPITADCSGVGSSILSSLASCAGVNLGVPPPPASAGGGGLSSSQSVSWVTAASPLRSWRHLAAALVDGAARRRRADPAAVVRGCPVLRTWHRGGDLLDERLRPAGIGVIAQRPLALDGRLLRLHGLADVDQLGTPRLGRTELGERSEQHSELVDAELRVAFQVGGGRLRRAGLQVDDDGAAVFVAFQPVDLPGDQHVVDPDPQLLLDPDQFPVVAALPVHEPPDHLARGLALPDAVPGTAEVEPVPDLVDPPRDVRLIGALSHERRGRV